MSPETQLEAAVCFVAANVEDPLLRAKFLDQACAGDPALRAAVDALLQDHHGAEDFFAKGRVAVNVPEVETRIRAAVRAADDALKLTEPVDEQIGSRVGRYKLLQKIGEGGCGTVYLAEQEEPVSRQVALKVIKLGMDTKNVIARFEAERQALAMMDHPNIARVLDAGATATGRPFFVMELVRGTRITQYCDEHNLETDRRLELFVQVCRAIQHAHQKGIIHRDIKPSNILVTLHDGVAVPKVIDFGIAKATEGRLTDHTFYTAVEQFVGTPAYMSPEQADVTGLDIDTRSDIYSLGVLLYELLTGRTPFDSHVLMQSGVDEMRRTLRDQEPQLPSTMITSLRHTELAATAGHRHAEPPKLISQLKGDLDWIVMKALEKDRNRRYETANGLAMDIQRFLNNEPVVARPPSQYYRLKKLVRRNKVVFVSGAVVVLTLLAGLGMSTWMFMREREARHREMNLRTEAENRAKITQAVMYVSQGRYDDANQILDQYKTSAETPSLDSVSAFRSIGEWLALHERWQEAATRYLALLQIDKLDNLNQVAIDYEATGVVLAKNNDPLQYQQLWREMVTNFTATPNDSILISALMYPLDKEELLALRPMADTRESQFASLPQSHISEWTLMPMALWKYRSGDYAATIRWCQRPYTAKLNSPACEADIHLVMAMAEYQQGQVDDACAELTQGRQIIENKFRGGIGRGSASSGYWFDWYYAGQLLTEASTLVNCDSDTDSSNPAK